MLDIFKIIETIFSYSPISSKKQIIKILKEKFPDLTDKQIQKMLQVALDIYKRQLRILLFYPGKNHE